MQLSKKLLLLMVTSGLLTSRVHAADDSIAGAFVGVVTTVVALTVYFKYCVEPALKESSTLREKVESLEQELAAKHAKNMELDDQIAELKHSCADCNAALNSSKGTQQWLKDSLAAAKKEMSEVRQKLSTSKENSSYNNEDLDAKLQGISHSLDNIERLFRDDNEGNTY